MIRRLLAARRERAMHNDLDYECRYWWGDRQGSLKARCHVCNPAEKRTA